MFTKKVLFILCFITIFLNGLCFSAYPAHDDERRDYQTNRPDLLSSEFFQKQGEAYCEVGLYHEAIDALNKAIAKNLKNFEAYFQRASSYFEIGNFDHALSDYLISKKKKILYLLCFT